MSGLLSLLNSDLGKEIIGGISNETGTPETKTAETLDMALPLLVGAMKKNVQQPDGAASLMNALEAGNHDGSLLDNLGGFFGGGVDNNAMQDGAGILGHLFGSKQPEVENALSNKSGLNMDTISKILKVAAPLVLAYLAKQKRQNNVQQAGDLNGLLGSMLGGQPSHNQDMLTSLLDADGDGSFMDDVANMVVGNTKKRGGLGGMLDSLMGGNS
ncbi:DUF937 domain-containing protein [Robertkochia solimangrovi]|uniref:DUF937 domain-containing protein n=1 Tax=Robertkochia solimangrovi TaxID=2213046 RepID=UPI001180EA3C|nr:DUF937 domain-containing protein [Robertkochia solimangrovi]TRZ45324.1 hypothetical protein DMZ48_06140 [Robertkochia solimangrovi]